MYPSNSLVFGLPVAAWLWAAAVQAGPVHYMDQEHRTLKNGTGFKNTTSNQAHAPTQVTGTTAPAMVPISLGQATADVQDIQAYSAAIDEVGAYQAFEEAIQADAIQAYQEYLRTNPEVFLQAGFEVDTNDVTEAASHLNKRGLPSSLAKFANMDKETITKTIAAMERAELKKLIITGGILSFKEYLRTGVQPLFMQQPDLIKVAKSFFKVPDKAAANSAANVVNASVNAGEHDLVKRGWWPKGKGRKIAAALTGGAAAAGAIVIAAHGFTGGFKSHKNDGNLALVSDYQPQMWSAPNAPAVAVPEAALVPAPAPVVDTVVIDSTPPAPVNNDNDVGSGRSSMESTHSSIDSPASPQRPSTPVNGVPFAGSNKYNSVFQKWQNAEKINGNPLVGEPNPWFKGGGAGGISHVGK